MINAQNIPAEVKARFLRGLCATSVSPFVTAAIQLGMIPLLIKVWGAAKYGDWVTLSAIPAYLTLTDLGFGDASGNDMTLRVAAGDNHGALRTFQSSWCVLTIMSAMALAVVSIAVREIPLKAWLRLSSLENITAQEVILILSAYVVLCQQNGIIESGFRCTGKFALGTLFCTVLRMVEAVNACLAGLLTGSLIGMALAYLLTRAVGTIAFALILRKTAPWLRLGITHADLAASRQLALPALGFLALPTALALNFQGTTVLVGILLGPVAVTGFTTLRTLTRVSSQITSTISHSLWPELSRAFGSGEVTLARDLHGQALRASLVYAVLLSLGLGVFGARFYHIWLPNQMAFDQSCFRILIASALVNSLWTTSSMVVMATNRHLRFASYYLLTTTVALFLAKFLGAQFGLAGVSSALLLNDCTMLIVATKASSELLNERCTPFIQELQCQ